MFVQACNLLGTTDPTPTCRFGFDLFQKVPKPAVFKPAAEPVPTRVNVPRALPMAFLDDGKHVVDGIDVFAFKTSPLGQTSYTLKVSHRLVIGCSVTAM